MLFGGIEPGVVKRACFVFIYDTVVVSGCLFLYCVSCSVAVASGRCVKLSIHAVLHSISSESTNFSEPISLRKIITLVVS